MRRVATAKVVLALTGVLVFGLGLRLQMNTLRWVGIAIVALAWMMRFVKGDGAN